MQFAISRRAFMKLAGTAAMGAALFTTAPTGSAKATDTHAHTISYAGKDIPVLCEAEVCVIGGGPAGVAAAVQAAERGVRAWLIERGITLGGLQTMGNVIPCMTSFAPDSDTPFVTKLKKHLLNEGIAYNDHTEGSEVSIWTNPEVLSRIYDDLCEESGVEVLYNTVFVDTIMDGKKITAIIVQTIAGLRAIRAKAFIDGSGDAVLARTAGVPSERGYEKTGNNQPMSFRFEMGGIDMDRLYDHITNELKDPWCKSPMPYFTIAEARHRTTQYVLEKFMVAGLESGELTEADVEYMQGFAIIGKPGTMSMNCPELPVEYSATDPISYSRGVREGRKMLHRISRYFIKHMPGFENAYLNKEASMLGARESWRIRGKVYLTEDDYHKEVRYPDAVARTAWYIDAHGENVSAKLAKGSYYEIPYRAMIAVEVENLIVAGRCISASFILQASMRIQVTCMSIGEAAGIAAAWAVKHNVAANTIEWAKLPEEERSYVSR